MDEQKVEKNEKDELSEASKAFVARLREIVNIFGSNLETARRIGVTETTIRRWLLGAEPRKPALSKLAKAAGVSYEWLAHGKGERSIKIVENDRLDKQTAQKLLDLPASAWKEIEFEEWDCEVPNMEPTLHVGDRYLVDMSTKLPGDGVYLIEIGGQRRAMRVQLLPGAIAYSNDNPIYKGADFTVPSSEVESEVKVVGKILRMASKKPA